MKKILLYSTLLLIILANACTKVNNLSDHSALNSFEISAHSPSGIELGKPVIKNDTVFIPVKRGAALFPLTISANPVFDNKTEKAVPGSSFSSFDKIVFDINDEPKHFFLIGRSGMPHKYHLALQISNQLNDAYITSLSVKNSPKTAAVAQSGYIDPIAHEALLPVINAEFPLTLNTIIGISPEAKIIKIKSKTVVADNVELKFNSITDTLIVDVEAESGKVQAWKVAIMQTTEAGNSIPEVTAKSLSFVQSKTTAETAENSGTFFEALVSNNTVTLRLIPAKSDSIEITPTLPLYGNSQLVGFENRSKLTFADYNEQKEFYVVDNNSGLYKKWKLRIEKTGAAEIFGFDFEYETPKTIKFDDTVTIDNKNCTIRLYLKGYSSNSAYWPLVVKNVKIKSTQGSTNDTEGKRYNFENVKSTNSFTITGTDGVLKNWTLKLEQRVAVLASANDIFAFKIAESSTPLKDYNGIVNKSTTSVFIDFADAAAFPLIIKPEFTLSNKAETENFTPGEYIRFNSFNDTVKINVVAENGNVSTWNIALLNTSQLFNCDFEKWVKNSSMNLNAPSIDPYPGQGRGWATANNLYVKGTKGVENGEYGLAAELSTSVVTQIPKNLITAATLYLGRFDLSSLTLDKPKNMTKFGIPFTAKPTAVVLDAKYEPGQKMQVSEWVKGEGLSAVYKLVDIEGEDKGHIWAELIYWKGEGKINYSGDPNPDAIVMSRGEHVFTGKSDWKKITVDMKPTADFDKYTPTHIVIVMTSSREGHLFKGAIGSKLTVDNLELKY